MRDYYVVTAQFGVPGDSIERFADHKAGPLVQSGALEVFDPKNKKHAAAKERMEREAERRRLSEEARLKQEREDPAGYQARVLAERKAHLKEMLKAQEANRKERIRQEQEDEREAQRLRARERDRIEEMKRAEAAV